MFINANRLLLGALLALQQCVSANQVHTEAHCFTRLTSPSPKGHVPTTSHVKTITSTRTVYITKTPSITVTPPPKTVLATVTSTSTSTVNVAQITDTYTSVVTESITSTLDLPTQTITSTVVSSETTTTTVQPASTVAAPAGFEPVLDTLPGASKKKRSINGSSLLARKQPTCQFSGSHQKKPQSWPAAVTCTGAVQSLVITTLTRTAKPKTVTARASTTTKTTTVVVTSTTLSITPDASTTVLSTLSLTSVTTNSPITTATTTVTSTTTATSNLPATTEYAICSSDNIASHLSGFQIDEYADRSGGLTGAATSDTTAQGCCNSCAANPQCGVAIFYAQSNFCILGVGSGTCSANQYSVEAGYNTGSTDPEYVVINGNCGAFNVNAGAS